MSFAQIDKLQQIIEAESGGGGMDPLVTVVVPCLNEEKTLAAVIQRAQKAFADYRYSGEVVVADNGSTDGSVEIATRLGARLVNVPVKGYGSALLGGIEAARGSIIVMGDADDTYDFLELDRLVEPIKNEQCEFMMGTRLRGHIEESAMPKLHRYLGTPVLTWLINGFFGCRISDCNCGLRAFSKSAFQRMEIHSTGMEFASEMIIKAALLKIKIGEAPVSLRVDRRGRAPHLRTWSDGWRHLRFILTYACDRVLLVPGLLLILAGIVGFAALLPGPIRVGSLFMDFHFLFPSSLAVILGTQLCLFSALARAYTGLSRYVPSFRTLRKFLTLERAMIGGGIIFLLGLAINVLVVAHWLHTYGSGLFAVRSAICALTLMAVGAQVMFNSFFISVLKIPQRVVIADE